MLHFHLRDVDKLAPNGKDVALGEGAAQIEEAFRYMHAHGASSLLVFEYERDQKEPLKYIIPSLPFLEKIALELGTEERSQASQ